MIHSGRNWARWTSELLFIHALVSCWRALDPNPAVLTQFVETTPGNLASLWVALIVLAALGARQLAFYIVRGAAEVLSAGVMKAMTEVPLIVSILHAAAAGLFFFAFSSANPILILSLALLSSWFGQWLNKDQDAAGSYVSGSVSAEPSVPAQPL